MRKCYYCDNEGIYLNPYNDRYYCEKHAISKMNDYIKEYSVEGEDSLRDWFDKKYEHDYNLMNCSLNVKTGEIIYHAYNNGKQTNI